VQRIYCFLCSGTQRGPAPRQQKGDVALGGAGLREVPVEQYSDAAEYSPASALHLYHVAIAIAQRFLAVGWVVKLSLCCRTWRCASSLALRGASGTLALALWVTS
jgi:hypothetical protein